MCGILGIVRNQGSPVELTEGEIVRLRDTMVRRGPDGAGLWREPSRGHVALAHRRLAVVDLKETGAQPMQTGVDAALGAAFNSCGRSNEGQSQCQAESAAEQHQAQSAVGADEAEMDKLMEGLLQARIRESIYFHRQMEENMAAAAAAPWLAKHCKPRPQVPRQPKKMPLQAATRGLARR